MKTVVGILSFCFAVAASAGNLYLAWDPSPSSGVTGYALYVGTTSGAYQQRFDVGTQTSATVSNLSPGLKYYVTVRAYDAANVESPSANEVSYVIPGAMNLSMQPAAGVQLNFVSEPGKTYLLQATTDLKNWTTLQTVQSVTNAWTSWVDPQSAEFDHRFYRIVTAP